jgi:nicotinamide riboside kinase
MTLVVNLFGGPGCGKSTTAADVFANLKKQDFNCELVTEYTKDCVWSGGKKVFNDQIYLLGKQHFRMFRLKGEVDIVVTDAPLLLSMVYNKIYAGYEHLDPLVLEAFNRFDNLNYVLVRSKKYNPLGRHQSEPEAIQLDHYTLEMLKDNGIPYKRIPYNQATGLIIEDVKAALGHETEAPHHHV